MAGCPTAIRLAKGGPSGAASRVDQECPPPLTSSQNHRLGTQAHRQCPRNGRSRQGNRLRLPRVGAHGIYDTNDPQSYISPVRQRRTASQVDELWDRWRVVEAKKRRGT